MSEIKKINPVEGLNELTKTAGDALNKAGQAVSETIDMVGETLNSAANTVNETVITPVADFIQAPHSIDQLLDKLQGSYGMVAYGMFKAGIERAPIISAGVLVTETIVENTVVSKPVAQIVHKGFETLNGAILPEEWLKFGEEAFIKTEQGFNAVSRMVGDNINVVRSAGARLNVVINSIFAGFDAKKVWDHYVEMGEEGIDHAGEVIGRFLGETVGGAGGFAAGMAAGTAASAAITGAVCGSVVPGVGTVVGLAAGAVVGGVACVVGGDIGASIGSHVDGNDGEFVPVPM